MVSLVTFGGCFPNNLPPEEPSKPRTAAVTEGKKDFKNDQTTQSQAGDENVSGLQGNAPPLPQQIEAGKGNSASNGAVQTGGLIIGTVVEVQPDNIVVDTVDYGDVVIHLSPKPGYGTIYGWVAFP